jgi:tRNA G18 (ribose-2'-O)-methylase SpoU
VTIVRIDALDDPRVAEFRAAPDPVLLRERGLFVAEGRFVIQTLLQTRRFRVRALLLTEHTYRSLADEIAAAAGDDVPVYVAASSVFKNIGGYDFHRGYLALAERPEPLAAGTLIGTAAAGRPLLVLERIGNPDNVGGIFRNAAAFGATGVLLSPGCSDPLYRKAVRTSTGASLRVPYAVVDDWPAGLEGLRERRWRLVALTPDAEAIDIRELRDEGQASSGVALVLGAEGEGLSAEAIAMADARVRIRIEPAVDSLNVATAAAIALHHLLPSP